ncbi:MULTISPECIES: transcriptional regulator HexR [Iodobacter]|uniref:Als operon repressor n=2 Tax=Iodobacter TaxID=32014 RepID=A0A377Q7A7_9NEIS|nr:MULTISPECIES: transcriptional regulator HexR [Iodobacter]NHQ87800.1 transcriptional regulator HexR [Iodobacter violacea]TCU84127.1 RpiR family transcriptional regulator [Iodobacter fluviatilis]STQ89741.1 Als operon repressor [Iodobacter fluviatilis]
MLERIKAALDSLSKSERKVAELVIEQPNLVANAPIAQIADLALVSQPTVIRFCRSLNCSGLQDFKLRLTRSLVSGVPYVHSMVSRDDSAHDLARKLFDNNISHLLRCRNELDTEVLERAITIMSNAKKIEVYGQGQSGAVAIDAQNKFFRLGVPTVSYTDPHMHGMSASMLGPGDAVVAISNSGRTLDLLRSVEIARDAGADVIGITHSKSPLAKRCSLCLFADTMEDPDLYTPMITRIVHLVIIDVLAVGVALRRGPELIDQLEKMKRSLKEKRVRGHDNYS